MPRSQTITALGVVSYANGRSSSALTTEKMVVFAPTPSATASTATAVNPGFFHSIRAAKPKSRQRVIYLLRSTSFVPEGDHRVHLRRPARREEAGEESHAEQRQRDAGEGQRVGRRDAVEQARQDARQRERPDQPDDDARERQAQPLPDDEFEDVRGARAQGHPHAYLVAALCD